MLVLSRKEKFCAHCFKNVKAEKRISIVSLVLLVLSLCSFGALLPVWFVYEMVFLAIFQEDKVMNIFHYQCFYCQGIALLPPKQRGFPFWSA